MKYPFYVVPALMLASGIVWSDPYYGGYRSSPYGVYGNPYSPPVATPYPPNTLQVYGYQGTGNNPYAQNPVPGPYGNYRTPYSSYSAQTPYNAGSPYTPYSSPNPYRAHVNPYAPDSNNTPYDARRPYEPGNVANPYGVYGNSYTPNPAYPTNSTGPYPASNPYHPGYVTNPYGSNSTIYPATGGQPLYDSQGNYRGTYPDPNAVSPIYGNPYPSNSINNVYGIDNQYGPDSNQIGGYQQGIGIYGQ